MATKIRAGITFRLLGPLTVTIGERGLSLRSGRQRSLLAALLIRANQTISVAELIARVWPGGCPVDGRGMLHTQVMRLRRALREFSGVADLIRTAPAGYRMVIEDPHGLDLLRFEALDSQARQAAAQGDHAAESAYLADALRLWHGPALADIPSEALQASHGTSLTERRLSVLDRRIAADLRLGREADLIPELFALTAENPLRERFWEHLMLALYRAGRQAEALLTYQRARRLLVELLGVEPGPELRALEYGILNHDTALAGHRLMLPVTAAPR